MLMDVLRFSATCSTCHTSAARTTRPSTVYSDRTAPFHRVASTLSLPLHGELLDASTARQWRLETTYIIEAEGNREREARGPAGDASCSAQGICDGRGQVEDGPESLRCGDDFDACPRWSVFKSIRKQSIFVFHSLRKSSNSSCEGVAYGQKVTVSGMQSGDFSRGARDRLNDSEIRTVGFGSR